MKSILHKWMTGLLELLMFFPIILFIGMYWFTSFPPTLWVVFLSLYYLLGIVLYRLFRGKWLWMYVSGFLLTGAAALVEYGLHLSFLFGWILGLVGFYRAVIISEKHWKEIYPDFFLAIGVLVHFIAYFFYANIDLLKPYLTEISWTGILNLVLALFLMNSVHLKSVAASGDKEPVVASSVLRQNRLFILLTLLIILIASTYSKWEAWLKWVVLKFFAFISWLVHLIPQYDAEQKQGAAQMPVPKQTQVETSSWMALLEKIFYYLITAVIAVAAVFLLYYLGKKAARLLMQGIRWLFKVLQDRREDLQAAGGYVDEKENLVTLRELGINYKDKLKGWFTTLLEKEPRWEDLTTSRERARFLYRRLLLKSMASGYVFKKHLTPRETAVDILKWGTDLPKRPDEPSIELLISLYNRAKYSEEPVKDQEVEQLKKEFD